MVNKKRNIKLSEKDFDNLINEIVEDVLTEQVDYETFAKQLYDAMDGMGTDEDTVRDISDYGAAPEIAKWFDQNKNKFEGYTLRQWIEGDFSGSEVNTLLKKFGYIGGTTKKGTKTDERLGDDVRGTDCPDPKPWKTEGSPLKVGDRISNQLEIESINVLTQHMGSVKLTLSDGGGIINIYGDEVQSGWDVGANPLTVELGLKRYGDHLPTMEERDKKAALGEGYKENYNYIPYNMFVDLDFDELGYGTSRVGTYEDDTTKYDFHIPSYDKRPRGDGYGEGNPYTFYLVKIPLHVLPEGYNASSIGTVKKDYKGREYVQLDGKKVIKKYGEYPWIFVDTNQANPFLKKNKGKFYEGNEGAFKIKDTGTNHAQANGSRVSGDNLFKTTSVPLVTVEGDGGSLIRKSKNKSSLKLIISLNNSPDVWQAATELTGLATGYGKKGFPTEWARNGCNLRVETNNTFIIETFEQSYANSSKHNVTGSKYEEQTWLRTAKIGTEIVDKFTISFHVNMVQGIAASYMRDEWFIDKPYDKDGSYNWKKGKLHPAQWTYHTFLEIISGALLIALGFVSGGATWYVLGAYITINTANAIGYAMEGDYDMAILSLAFDFIPAGKLGKLFNLSVKSMVAPTKIIKGTLGVLQSFRGGGNFKAIMKTLKTNNDYLKLMRILAKDGAKMAKQMKEVFKQMPKQPITKESINAFRKELVKQGGSAGKLGKKLTDAELKIILKQQQTKTARYLDDLVNGGNFGQIILDAGLLISLYDTNIPLAILDKALQGVGVNSNFKGKGPSFGKSLKDALQWALAGTEWFDNLTGKAGISDGAVVDIVESTPCGPSDLEREQISKAHLMQVKNAKDYNPKLSATFYNWCEAGEYKFDKGVKYQYSAATSADLIDLNGATIDNKCEFINPDHYGITKTHKVGSYAFNTALKEDWLNGWRPGLCLKAHGPINDMVDPEDVTKHLESEQGGLSTELDDVLKTFKDDLWQNLFTPAANNYKDLMDGTIMEIKVGGKTYKITSSFNKQFATAFLGLPEDAQEKIFCVMNYYAEIESVPEFEIDELTQLPTKVPSILKCLEEEL